MGLNNLYGLLKVMWNSFVVVSNDVSGHASSTNFPASSLALAEIGHLTEISLFLSSLAFLEYSCLRSLILSFWCCILSAFLPVSPRRRHESSSSFSFLPSLFRSVCFLATFPLHQRHPGPDMSHQIVNSSITASTTCELPHCHRSPPSSLSEPHPGHPLSPISSLSLPCPSIPQPSRHSVVKFILDRGEKAEFKKNDLIQGSSKFCGGGLKLWLVQCFVFSCPECVYLTRQVNLARMETVWINRRDLQGCQAQPIRGEFGNSEKLKKIHYCSCHPYSAVYA